jgi:putative endopeptidase
VERVWRTTPPRTWQRYLQWHILHAAAPVLPKRFVDEDFKLTQALTGQRVQRPRWKRCVAATDEALGELLAQPFVAKHFPSASRQAARDLVLAISRVFGRLARTLDWMDAPTRQQALQKLGRMAYLIGYPDRWRRYPFKVGLVYGENALAAWAQDLQEDLRRVGKPVDRGRWEMSPPTVNAYYHPLKNQMVFPAGILQPPFYNPRASAWVNLGGMGMVVGHELTHGFDDQGAKFDAKGRLRNWWTPAVKKQFERRTQCVVKQYAAYETLPGVRLNGKLTAGENIADMGGIKLAFRAYRALRRHARTIVIADGFSEDQQFFLAVAQIWCAKATPAFRRLAAKVDPHSPPRWRVNGALANTPEFARAFRCRRGTPMNPLRTCRVW